MRRLVSFLILGLSLLVEPLNASLKVNNSDLIIANAAELDVEKNKVKEVDIKTLDYGSYMRGENSISYAELPYWTPDDLDNYESESVSEMNHYINGTYSINSDSIVDMFSVLAVESDLNYVTNDQLCFIQLADNYYSLFLNHCSPIIYLNQEIKEQKNISFYLDANYIAKELFDNLIESVDNELLNGSEIPLLKINDYVFLKIKFTKTGYQLLTDNYAVITTTIRGPIFTTEASTKLVYKVTIPFIDKITDFYYFNCFSSDDNSVDSFLPDDNIFFRMDESMHDDYYFYAFDLLKVSVVDKYIVVDNSTYFSSSWKADLISIKFTFKGNKREKTKLGNNVEFTIIPQAKTYEFNFDNTIGYVDGHVHYWYFDDFDLEKNVSGEIKILSISFHPYKPNMDNVWEIDSSKTLVHNYEKANIHKYSFDYEKSVRVYYYKMSGYYRNEFRNWHVATIAGGWAVNATHNYQVFGFDFFFDSANKFEIPNVKSITIKYQFGYSGPNPKEGTNGFYPNDPDEPYKDIRIKTLEVTSTPDVIGKYDFGVNNLQIDDEGMGLTDDANSYIMTDDSGYTHDYVIYKWRKRGTDYYSISTMDALEITYETEAMETVRMVGNSLGLHVVVDEDGNTYVCDSEGNVKDDYGYYEADDGSLIPGKDTNGDGEITIDETINSDTGEKAYPEYTGNEKKPTTISDWFNSLKDSITNDWLSSAVRIIVIIAIIILVIKLLPTLLSISFKRKKKRKR